MKYFTARVQDRPDDLGLAQRQDTYIRALEAHSGVEVHYGQFKRRRKARPLADKLDKGIVDIVVVIDTEEKGSDVSLGAHLVWDACHDKMDVALVLSNDSDLQTPVTMAEEVSGVRVITVNPHKAFRSAATAAEPRQAHPESEAAPSVPATQPGHR